jgi:hypothetical protein
MRCREQNQSHGGRTVSLFWAGFHLFIATHNLSAHSFCHQLSQVYSSMKLSRLSQLIPFFTESQIEHFILRSVKSRALQVRLCHRTRSISFATNVFVVESNESALEGPQLQVRHVFAVLAACVSVFYLWNVYEMDEQLFVARFHK